MNRVLSLILALAMSVPAWADYQAGSYQSAQSRFGMLHVVGDIGSQRLVFNTSDLGVTTHAYSIDGLWALDGGAHDWVVLRARHGGNMCGGFALLALKISAEAVVRTNEFGVCRGAPIDIRVTAEAMELDVSDPSASVAYRTFRFDGANLTETPVAQTAAPPAGAGVEVMRWLGQHPQALTNDPSEQARFAGVMGPAQMDDMSRRMSGPGATTQQGDWIVGEACQAHQCNAAAAAWAIRISDGAAFAVFYDGASVAQVFAGNQQLSGPVVQRLLSGRSQ